MNTWKTANAVVRHLEATSPVYDVRQAARRRSIGCEIRVRDAKGGWDW